jgi:hypothetical protein
MSYCFDTSAFIHSWVRTSPPDIFVTLWGRLDGKIAEGGIVSPEGVLKELERVEGDTLLAWVKQGRDPLIVPLGADLQEKVGLIGAQYQSFVAGDADKNMADPWVIGLAMARNLTVVTQESKPGTPAKPTLARVRGLARRLDAAG